MNNISINLKNVKKEYLIHHEKPTLVEKFIRDKDEKYAAISKINLTVKRGERLGIIGPNGSGKTTLLKIIAGITAPTTGSVKTYGRVASLIDLSAGFHNDLNGYQNIYLNGMLLGMPKREIDEKINSMIEFSGIRQFIDAPLFTYSEGMKLRLGFSIIAYINPDIVLLDENMAVGDEDFARKSFKKIQEEFFKKDKTVIMVSHLMKFISASCKTAILMDRGKIVHKGRAKSVVSQYLARFGPKNKTTKLK